MLSIVKYSVIYQQETITMTMKLPIILSAMIAAFAITGTSASQAADPAAAPADAAATDAPAPADATAAPADAAPAAEAPKKGKHKAKKHAATAEGGEAKPKRHRHKREHRGNNPQGAYKGSYDDMNLRGADGDVNVDQSPKAGPAGSPGHKM